MWMGMHVCVCVFACWDSDALTTHMLQWFMDELLFCNFIDWLSCTYKHTYIHLYILLYIYKYIWHIKCICFYFHANYLPQQSIYQLLNRRIHAYKLACCCQDIHMYIEVYIAYTTKEGCPSEQPIFRQITHLFHIVQLFLLVIVVVCVAVNIPLLLAMQSNQRISITTFTVIRLIYTFCQLCTS